MCFFANRRTVCCFYASVEARLVFQYQIPVSGIHLKVELIVVFVGLKAMRSSSVGQSVLGWCVKTLRRVASACNVPPCAETDINISHRVALFTFFIYSELFVSSNEDEDEPFTEALLYMF